MFLGTKTPYFLACFIFAWFASPAAFTEEPTDLSQPLPIEPKITMGSFENGLTYYIRVNQKPEQRAELRLVVNAGAILEDDDQRGLAHFVEHMAFNGTENFAKQELVDYLESIGMRFGPDINAYTSFDETVYMLQLPTDNPEILAKAFQILEDWARGVSFEESEIDKERGVIVEEWRLGRGAAARIRDKQFPILFHGSRYAERLIIGDKEILENAPQEAIRRYYRDWYRPDLMAVVAVGDFDPQEIQRFIRKHFEHLPTATNPRPRETYPVPDHDQTLYAPASDPEVRYTNVSMYFKQPLSSQGSYGDYRRSIAESLYSSMLNQRLFEISQQAHPPYLAASSGKSNAVRSKAIYALTAIVQENGIEAGFEAVLREAERVKRHGFTKEELEREKTKLLRNFEQVHMERDKLQSSAFAAEYIRNFLNGESLPGIELEYQLHNRFVPEITLEEINKFAEEWMTEENRVILVSATEKESMRLPEQQDLLSIIDAVAAADIEPYAVQVSKEPLLAAIPPKGEIVAEKTDAVLGLTEWKFSNGLRLVLKETDFQNDQLLFTAFSPGGHSLVEDEDFVAGQTADSIIQQSGVGNLSLIDLQKKLAGKAVRVSPYIAELEEGMSGSASPKDIETMFQLIYLYFTEPRSDMTAFQSFQNRIKEILKNRDASPEAQFGDMIQRAMSQNHHRRRPWSAEVMAEMNLQRSLEIYRDRFADAGDFTFLMVGNFQIDSIKPLALTYLGGLPTKGREETWRDVQVTPPKGKVVQTLRKGLEAKSQVRLVYNGDFDWTRSNRYTLSSAVDVLRIKLREKLREEMGGTYGVGINVATAREPHSRYQINIRFSCAPENVEKLVGEVFAVIDKVKTDGPEPGDVLKVQETQRRQHETDLKENGFWLQSLAFAYQYDESPQQILNFNELVEALTSEAVGDAVRRYFDTDNYAKFVLLPE